MNPKVTIAALLLLAACGGNPMPDPGGDGDGDGGDGTITVPESVAVNVKGAKYDPDKDRLQLTIALDSSNPVLATYERAENLDVKGYRAYKMQEDPLDRMFVALAAESADGKTRAVTVADGGQFGEYRGGGHYERDGNFDPPSASETKDGTGLVTYAGRYAGVQNIDEPGNPDVLEPVPGTDPTILPSQPRRVRGEIVLNADFVDNEVNGAIINRRVVGGAALDTVFLRGTGITEDGTFEGEVSAIHSDAETIEGSYGGVFGGSNSSSVAGLVHLTAFDDDIDLEQEHGVFVLTQCGQTGAAQSICDQVDPQD
ncbi:MAG: thymidylate synthase [Gemmobacter sp.]|uniref:thymidylate synthase n=1 Tax=Gemmobacter sp. TaxID=1898957 RepID=UPI001A57DFF3|nr:thymidylate synthase [Gemmobacter sp.]MBL8562474.1 thymidylate synthase [Gemmobacter sp.]